MGASRAKRRRLGDDQGASAVEFAIIAPLFFLLVFGIINFGWLFAQQLQLNHAVREGARAAVVQSTGQDGSGNATAIPPLVRGAVTAPLVIGDDVTVSSGTCPGDGGKQNLTVTASYPAELLAPMPIPGFPNSYNLQAAAVFRCEW